jgi:hypothetical protein
MFEIAVIPSAVIQTRLEFLHHWTEAPEEVKFLRSLHRHELHIRVEFAQEHCDRHFEYIMEKRALDKWLADRKSTWPKRTSCEDVCNFLLGYFRRYGPNLPITIEVLEDGENGAILRTNTGA